MKTFEDFFIAVGIGIAIVLALIYWNECKLMKLEPEMPQKIEVKTEEAMADVETKIVEEMTEEEIEEEIYFDSLELLAICVEAEAGNQGIEGKRMVADVILNRVDDKDWPNTIEEVIKQPYQFSSYWDGAMDRIKDIPEETYKAVRMELEERGWPGIYYFTAGNYSKYGTPWKQVGDHYFSKK